MKIGFLIRYFNKGMGGAENNCYYLAKELAKNKDNEVHIFCSDKADGEETIDGIKVHRCRETLKLTYYLAFYPSLTKKLLSYDLDILHVHGFGFIQNDLSIKKLKRKNPGLKIICTPHGPFMALKNYNLFAKTLKTIYVMMIRRNLKIYNKIIQVNPYQKEWLKNDYHIDNKKIVFLPNGISEEAFTQTSKDALNALKDRYSLKNKFVISYLGRIQDYKGIDQIIKILPELKKLNSKIVFLAIGKDAGDLSRLKELAKTLNVENSVIFTGEVSEEEKYGLLDLSEIFIFPSEWEAFGIVVLEAMAKKNALLSTKTEGGRYLIKKENGFLFDYQNTNQLLKVSKKLIADSKLRRKMQNNNFKKSKNFLWDKIAKDLFRIYLDL